MILNDLDVMYLKGLRLLAGLNEEDAADRLGIPTEQLKKQEQPGIELDRKAWLNLIDSYHALGEPQESFINQTDSLDKQTEPISSKISVNPVHESEFCRRYSDSVWVAMQYGLNTLENRMTEDLNNLRQPGFQDLTLAELEHSASLEWLPRQFRNQYGALTLNLLIDSIHEVREKINNPDLYRLTTPAQELIFEQASVIGISSLIEQFQNHPHSCPDDEYLQYLESVEWRNDYLNGSFVGPYLFGNLKADKDNCYHYYYWFIEQFNLKKDGLPEKVSWNLKNGKPWYIRCIEQQVKDRQDFDFD